MKTSRAAPLVLGIEGSPRRRSNSELLVARVLVGAAEAGAETALISLRSLRFSSCQHCGGCDRTGRCVLHDGMEEVYAKLRAATHLVLGSPIHFAGVSGETKAMIDRGQCCWVGKYRLKQAVSEGTAERRGVFAATCGGADTKVFGQAKPTVKAFFNSTGFRYWGELFEPATDDPPALSERADMLARAQELGRQLLGK